MALSKPCSSNPIGWTTYYERNKQDGGGIQRLFEAGLSTLSIITTSHFKKPDKLIETIAGSTYANMIMVAADDDGTIVNLLHHGFVNASTFGERLPSSSSPETRRRHRLNPCPTPVRWYPSKLDRGRTRGAAIDSPTLNDMLNVEYKEFADLRGGGNTILRDKPNHMMIGPAVFMIAEGLSASRPER
jgi:hypothetical protein